MTNQLDDEKFLAKCEKDVNESGSLAHFRDETHRLIRMVRERSRELETSLEVNDATRKDYQARCEDLLKERNAWIATVELERSCVKGTHSYERITTLEAKLGKAREALELIEALPPIHERDRRSIARSCLEEISR